jgi:hypothetical protein
MDYKITRSIVKDFVETARRAHDSYAHPAGYLESLVVQLLSEVPPNSCMQHLQTLERETALAEKQCVLTEQHVAQAHALLNSPMGE